MYTLSLWLLNLYVGKIIRYAGLHKSQDGIKIAGRNINIHRYEDAVAAAKSSQLCPTLCDPIDGRPPGSPVPGILQARTLNGLPCPSPMHESEVAQSCPTLSDLMDCSLPGSSAHGIFQTKVLEWGAIDFSGKQYGDS